MCSKSLPFPSEHLDVYLIAVNCVKGRCLCAINFIFEALQFNVFMAGYAATVFALTSKHFESMSAWVRMAWLFEFSNSDFAHGEHLHQCSLAIA